MAMHAMPGALPDSDTDTDTDPDPSWADFSGPDMLVLVVIVVA